MPIADLYKETISGFQLRIETLKLLLEDGNHAFVSKQAREIARTTLQLMGAAKRQTPIKNGELIEDCSVILRQARKLIRVSADRERI